MKRDSFVTYRSFYEAVKSLDYETIGKVYVAINEYALDHNEVECEGIIKTIFTLIKPQLEASFQKAISGSKGGKVSKSQSSEELEDKEERNISTLEANPKQNGSKTKANNKQNGSKQKANFKQNESKTEANNKQTASNANANVNANVNVNVNANVNDDIDIKNKIISLLSSSKDIFVSIKMENEYEKILKMMIKAAQVTKVIPTQGRLEDLMKEMIFDRQHVSNKQGYLIECFKHEREQCETIEN